MVKTKLCAVMGCLLIAALLSAVAQTNTVPQLRDPAIPPRTLPGTIERSIVSQAQPKVIVSTGEIKDIKANSAMAYYSVTFEGLSMGTDIRASSGGVVVSPSPGPTVERSLKFGVSKNCATSTTGNGCSEMTGLKPLCKYYVRAFYTITEGKITGTFYGNERDFTTLAPSK